MGRWITRLAGISARPPVALGLVAAIALVDLTFRERPLSFLLRAVEDEPCHLASAIVVLGALTRWRGRPPSPAAGASMLAASVLIDVDHLPLQFGSDFWTRGTARPYTHALWLIVALAAIAGLAAARHRASGAAASRITAQITGGAACGIAVHFLRDLGTAPISLWWPLSDSGVTIPYSWYLAALVAVAVVPGWRRRTAGSPARLPTALDFSPVVGQDAYRDQQATGPH